jgi:uncharacterized protein YneF (UPF0154 family)
MERDGRASEGVGLLALLLADGFDGSNIVGGGVLALIFGLIGAYFFRRDQVIKSLNDEITRLTRRIEEQDKRLYQEEATTRALQDQVNRQHDQIVILQVTGKQSSFAGWTINTEGILIDVTPAFERNMLINMGIKRADVEGKNASTVWPPQFAAALTALNGEAAIRPGHMAFALNVVIHPNLPPMMIAKTVAQYLDGRPYGVQGIAIPMSALVKLNGQNRLAIEESPLPPTEEKSDDQAH